MNLDKSHFEQPAVFGRQFEHSLCGTSALRRPYSDGCGFFGQGPDMNQGRINDEQYNTSAPPAFGQKLHGIFCIFF